MMAIPELGAGNIITGWPEATREIAQLMIHTYGEPDETTPSRLTWFNNGEWKRTIVYRNSVKHNFPFPHNDVLEQFVNLTVPMEKACELEAFNGSVAFYCTRGEISSCCNDEKANILAINLAYDIIRDKKTFQQARNMFTNSMTAIRKNKPAPYTDKLIFIPEENTGDPDEVTAAESEPQNAPAAEV